MSNCLIAYDNATTDGLSFMPWPSVADPNLYFMGTPNINERWVTTGVASSQTRFWWYFNGGATTLAFLALCNHNLSLAATVRLTASNDGFATTVYDSGFVAAYPAGTTSASRGRLQWNFCHRLSTPTLAAQWRVEISDAANPNGYVAVGRLFGGRSLWQPTINMDAGSAIGFEGGADVQTALNGTEWFTERQPFRVARFSLQAVSAEMLASGFDLLATAADSQRELFFQYDPADSVNAVRRSLFGRLRALSPIEEPYYGRMKTAFEIKELL